MINNEQIGTKYGATPDLGTRCFDWEARIIGRQHRKQAIDFDGSWVCRRGNFWDTDMISLLKAPRRERNDDGAYMYSFFRFGAELFLYVTHWMNWMSPFNKEFFEVKAKS